MHRLALLVLLAAAGAALGCGAGSEGERPLEFESNQRVWALPLDAFAPADVGASQYAANLLVRGCMGRAGYEWPIPAYDPDPAPSPTWNSVGRRLFDLEIASRYGYRIAPPADPAAAARELELNARTLTPAEEAMRNRCFRSSARRVAPPDTGLISSLAGAAYDAAKADERVLDAAGGWRRCMRPAGISDLPETPMSMPSPSVARRFGLATGDLGAAPGAAELKLAIADARCRRSSGYTRALYETEVEKQLDLVGRNRDALERLRAEARREGRKARAVIARHGG